MHHDKSSHWYDFEHDSALRHRDRQLYGSHYEAHEQATAPWQFRDEESDLGDLHHADKHYAHHEVPTHSRIAWPEDIYHDGHAGETFESEFAEDLHRHHDILDY